ncbi:hypothetical protein BD626DRAFT_576933 [Schizophyllum amplum]|uniref:Uncharacterized protein n=1 Tax=Schizophyllum amplum TaxID=97359 RepID=A0A550BSX5_9AGAR|nr:hypothetical protein BD626DRAFT_576933 [Auriculariopsis ampla]
MSIPPPRLLSPSRDVVSVLVDGVYDILHAKGGNTTISEEEYGLESHDLLANDADVSLFAARPFEKYELTPLKLPQLRNLIADWLDDIQGEEKVPSNFDYTTARKDHLIAVLVNRTYGSTTREPRLSFERDVGVVRHAPRCKRGAARTKAPSFAKATPEAGAYSAPAPSALAKRDVVMSFDGIHNGDNIKLSYSRQAEATAYKVAIL